MRTFLYSIIALAVIASSCSTSRTLSSSMEDDIYYVPGKKPLVVKEVESITGQNISMNQTSPAHNTASDNQSVVINRKTGKAENISMSQLSAQAEQQLANNNEIDATIYENTGYWLGDFKGSESDLEEAARIINQYPQGFGSVANGLDIATNLSFSPDWNVYTDNGRFWWFPSSTNYDLYTQFLFGNYPKYGWTVVWNSPTYDSWAFDSQFNTNFRLGWGGGIGIGIGWGNGFYNPWYGPDPYWNSWNNPWWGGGYYPGWGYPHHHWHNHWGHDHGWGGNYPSWGPPNRPANPQRPNNTGGVTGIRPGTRPGVSRPGMSRPDGSAVRPAGSTRPGSVTRPNTGQGTTVTRPGSTTRPGTVVNRPGSIRPDATITRPSTTTRPGTVTRPSNGVSRPGTVTRPSNSVSRPGTVTRPANGVSRPQYTRPATGQSNSSGVNQNSGSSVKNYSRPQNNYRPSYNNNSTSRQGNTSSYRSNSSYSPQRSSGNTHSAPPVQRSNSGRSGGRR